MTAPSTEDITQLAGGFAAPSLADWRRLIDKALKGGDFDRRLVARTADGIRVEPLYTTRPAGITAPVVQAGSQGWDIRQRHAGTDPAAVNAAILEDLAGGATSITLQMSAPGRSGLASDQAAIGRALEGVLLDVCAVGLDAGAKAGEAAAALIAVWNARGITAEQRQGAFGADPAGTLAATGQLPAVAADALAEAAALVRQTLPWPHVTALRADGHVWHAAGASEAQEVAAVFATVVAYLRAAEKAGVAPDAALPKIELKFAVDADELMGLAKLRAARRLLARIAGACGAASAASRVTLAAETSRTMMSKRDPWVNMLRTTMACATAAWGGADCITVLPYSWALGQPDAFARRMARNTSIVLMEESGLGRVGDPAAGSFAVETLTTDLETTAWSLFTEIEAAGGIMAVLASGKLQADIAKTAAAKRAAIATAKTQLTGTSAFPRLGDDGVKVTPWPAPAKAAAGGAMAVTPLTEFRPAAPFEALRDAADAHATASGRAPTVFLACLGPLSSHAARATWIANFLAAGGIAAVQSPPLLQSADAGRAFSESGASVACICGADETYGELGEATASLLSTAGAAHVYLAGRPKDQEAALKAAGVGRFIFAGSDMVDTLSSIHADLGVAKGAA